jgi:hypothetical protein
MPAEETEMKKEITLGQLVSIGIPIVLLIIGWGISVNTRIESNEVKTERNSQDISVTNGRVEKIDDKMDENFKIVIDKLERISERQNESK